MSHFMFVSHRVCLGIKSRCDDSFEPFRTLCIDLSFWAWSLAAGWDRRDFNFTHFSA